MATKKSEEKQEQDAQKRPAPDQPPEKIRHYSNDPVNKSGPDPIDAPVPRNGDPLAFQRDSNKQDAEKKTEKKSDSK